MDMQMYATEKLTTFVSNSVLININTRKSEACSGQKISRIPHLRWKSNSPLNFNKGYKQKNHRKKSSRKDFALSKQDKFLYIVGVHVFPSFLFLRMNEKGSVWKILILAETIAE